MTSPPSTDEPLESQLSISVSQKPTILVVDDQTENLHFVRAALSNEFDLIFATNGEKAIELAKIQRPNLILLDIVLPGESGYSIAKSLKSDPETQSIPIIFVSSMSNQTLGFGYKAVDYITKPINPQVLLARVRNQLSLVSIEQLSESQLSLIHCLGHAAEYRDNETGKHVIRMAKYSQIIGREMGLSKIDCEMLHTAAPLHDIGKIGIPDSILLKAGPLNNQEWEIMRKHPEIGLRIIGQQKSPLLKLAANIAYNHHEKFDGTGYPRGLQGKNIPLEARIVAIADVFDALVSVRPYKKAWPLQEAEDYIASHANSHFDPQLVPLFLKNLPEIRSIHNLWQDHEDDFQE